MFECAMGDNYTFVAIGLLEVNGMLHSERRIPHLGLYIRYAQVWITENIVIV